MAFVDVEIPEGEGGSFFKFNAIGDRLAGVFVSKGMGAAGNFGAKMEYVFKVRKTDGTPGFENVTVNPPTKLGQGFEKADLKPGHRVIATYTGDLPTSGKVDSEGKPYSPTKLFKLQVDTAIAPAGAAKPAAPPPPPPKPAAPAADEFDDIPL